MITLDEAAENLGRGVVYTPPGLRLHPDQAGPGERREDGVITSSNSRYVFVRYAGDQYAKATDPADLDWLRS